MTYRSSRFYRGRNSHYKPTVRAITVKYAGKCMCCGGTIAAGSIADYYPAGTIAGVHEGRLAHLKAVEGNSKACSEELKKRNLPDPIDTRYEDDCAERCGL
jgi:hypothetical protein